MAAEVVDLGQQGCVEVDRAFWCATTGVSFVEGGAGSECHFTLHFKERVKLVIKTLLDLLAVAILLNISRCWRWWGG